MNHAAKNLYNEGLYSVRQHFFRTGKYLPYSRNYPLLKNSENYKTLNSNMAQQILKEVDGTFRSFFGLLRLAGEGRYAHRDISIPHYLPKDGYMTLVVGFVRLRGNRFVLPYSNSFKKTHAPITITMPPVLEDKTIKGILFDGDTRPVYGEYDSQNPVHFSGKRVKRGLYRTSTGYEFNADVNGALNILRKSNVVCLTALYSRGVVATPLRIRVA